MKKTFKFSVMMCVAMIALVFTSCMHTTDPGYASVIVEKYGDNKGVQPTAVGPGTYYSALGQSYYDFPTFQTNWTFTKDNTEGSEGNEEFTFQTCEGMKCSMDLGLSMHFDVSKLPLMYTTYKKQVDEIRSTVVRNEIRDALNRVAGNMPIESVYGAGKGPLIDAIKKAVKINLTPKGIIVDNIYLIGSIRIPEAVEKSLDSKVAMTQEAEKIKNQVAKEEAQANISRVQAQGKADALKIQADAEAYYNRTVSKSLNKDLVDLKRIEKWNGVYPHTYGVNSGLLVR